MRVLLTLIVAFLLSLHGSEAMAAKRVALVIGNSAYQNTKALVNPKNDALGMTAALEATGFEVVSGLDLSKADMERTIRDFLARLRDADVALLFYAGHGLQVSNRNYLMPVDAKLKEEADLDFEFIPVSE